MGLAARYSRDGHTSSLEPALVPSATGLLRLSLVIAAVFAAGIGALVAASALVPTESVRNAVITEIRTVTGLEPTIRGDVTVSLFPTAMVSFTDVVLGDAAEQARDPALSADRLTAKLQLLPLLVGSIQPADMSLTRPYITVRLDPDGRSNWSNLMATLARTLKPGTPQAQRVLSFSEIRVSGGTISVVEPSRGVFELLSDVELSFAWPSISRSFGATGRFTWRGESIETSVVITDFLAAPGEPAGRAEAARDRRPGERQVDVAQLLHRAAAGVADRDRAMVDADLVERRDVVDRFERIRQRGEQRRPVGAAVGVDVQGDPRVVERDVADLDAAEQQRQDPQVGDQAVRRERRRAAVRFAQHDVDQAHGAGGEERHLDRTAHDRIEACDGADLRLDGVARALGRDQERAGRQHRDAGDDHEAEQNRETLQASGRGHRAGPPVRG